MITVRGGFGGKGKKDMIPVGKCTEYILSNNGTGGFQAGFSYITCSGLEQDIKVPVGKEVIVCVESGTLVIPSNGDAVIVGDCSDPGII